jgi:uncharacterized protein YndB with AHSA1/START domain
MSVQTGPAGRRFVQVEVLVAGTPEQVWQAIATGPGLSSWFVPTEIDEVDGKPVALRMNFGHGMGPPSPITAWQPPHSFTAQSEGWGGSPPIASEWSVEARTDGMCLVRVVNSLVADSGEWDHQLEGTEQGWPGFFRTLRLYLAHFPGQRAAILQLMVPVAGTEDAAWQTLCDALTMSTLREGQPWRAPAGAPALGGVAEHVSTKPNDMLLRLDVPGPGVAAFGTFGHGGQTMVAFNAYFYGEQADDIVAREQPRWQAWLTECFAR